LFARLESFLKQKHHHIYTNPKSRIISHQHFFFYPLQTPTMAVDPPLPPSVTTDDDFDIVSTYQSLLRSDPDLTMPVAAIESLVLALSHRPTSTISETLQYLSHLSNTLISSTPNPISLSAGTDLFQRYLISSLNRPATPGTATTDFEEIRRHLLTNGRLFVERAKASREKIARFGRHFVRDGVTVLTSGGSRVVGALLREAADTSGASVRFNVVYVLQSLVSACEGTNIVAMLRGRGVPVATIAEGAVAYSMGKVDMVIVGAEGVVENGGAISRLGTYQIALLAKAMGKPVYVVAESHKFVRLFPLGQYDLPITQRIVEFRTDEDGELKDEGQGKQKMALDLADAVDFTVSFVEW
jgi:translation initiation factor eIF-2B subunit alpha